jgi:cytosine/adenosine deaminase-related metal-dependent hydrolase
MSTLLIKNVTVVTVKEAAEPIMHGAVLVEDRHIAAVGPSDEVVKSHPPADRVVDGHRKVIAPGFVSTHNHVGYTVFRGRSEEAGLECVTGQYMPMNTIISRDERRAIGSLTCAELLKSGVTTILEMEEEVDVYAELIDAIGMRASMGLMTYDVDPDSMASGEYRYEKERRETQLKQAVAFAERWHGKANGRIRALMTPNMTVTSSPELLRASRAAADRLGMRLSTHIGWGPEETAVTQRLHGMSPFEYMQCHGLLAADVIAAHCYMVEEHDKTLLANAGTHVAHCPLMNSVRGHIAPILDYRSRGIPISLGIDNMFSDYFEVVRACVTMARIKSNDPLALLAKEALEFATLGGARALGLEADIGTIEVGKRADLMVVDFNRFGLQPMLDPVQNLVYHAHRDDVEMVLVDGAVVVDAGEICSLDARALIDPAAASAEAVWKRFVGKYGDIIAR